MPIPTVNECDLYGTTAHRPKRAEIGQWYFDITIGQPVVWTGTDWIQIMMNPSAADLDMGGFGIAGLGSVSSSILAAAYLRLVPQGPVAAFGSSKTDAAQLHPGFQLVTGANGTTGVILSSDNSNLGIITGVVNVVAGQTLKVYPAASAQIDALGTDAPLSLATKTALFWQTSGTQYYSLVGG